MATPNNAAFDGTVESRQLSTSEKQGLGNVDVVALYQGSRPSSTDKPLTNEPAALSFTPVDYGSFSKLDAQEKGKFRPASNGDPGSEHITRLQEGMKHRDVDTPEHKTSYWADGAVTQTDHKQQCNTYMDPSGDAMRQNADGTVVRCHIKDPKHYDGHSFDPEKERMDRIMNGKEGVDYTKTVSPDGRHTSYKFKDGTSMEADNLTNKVSFTDKQGNVWVKTGVGEK